MMPDTPQPATPSATPGVVGTSDDAKLARALREVAQTFDEPVTPFILRDAADTIDRLEAERDLFRDEAWDVLLQDCAEQSTPGSAMDRIDNRCMSNYESLCNVFAAIGWLERVNSRIYRIVRLAATLAATAPAATETKVIDEPNASEAEVRRILTTARTIADMRTTSASAIKQQVFTVCALCDRLLREKTRAEAALEAIKQAGWKEPFKMYNVAAAALAAPETKEQENAR